MTLPTFPVLPGIAYPVTRTALWSTLKQPASSGRETRIGLWSYPRWRYELTFEFLRADSAHLEWQALLGFYNSIGGGAGTFQFNDPADGTASGQVFGTGDGTTTTFQLARTLGSYTEPVFAPVGTPTITVAATVTTAFTVGPTGTITFTSPPAAGASLVWSGAYNWLCRFDDDTLESQQFMNTFWSAQKVVFTTVKL